MSFANGQKETVQSVIEGGIEAVTGTGYVTGWVRVAGQEPCEVHILYDGALVAEGMADAFRADLLAAGQAHGHFGFVLRLRRTLAPGACALVMHLPALNVSAPMAVQVPHVQLGPPRTLEDLLEPARGWTIAELLPHLSCLTEAAGVGRMGREKFADAAYRFALERWPSAAEARFAVESLEKGRLSAADLLGGLLRSKEREELEPWLMSPYDQAFPFET